MDSENLFQILLKLLFGGLAVIGVVLFAGFKQKSPENVATGTVVMWGTLPKEVMMELNDGISGKYKNVRFKYFEKDEATYVEELKEAFASGVGPDLFTVSSSEMLSLLPMSYILPPSFYSRADFENTYIGGAELFYTNWGLAATPFLVDPLVMYYNKRILSSFYHVAPPTTWNEFSEMASEITLIGDKGEIKRSFVPMGAMGNIQNGDAILSMMFLQTGNPMVVFDELGGKYKSVVSLYNGGSAMDVVNYFTAFAIPEYATYTWNNLMPEAQDAFVAEDAAVYFGFAGEYDELLLRNPNLDIGVAIVPNGGADESDIATFGNFVGLAVYRGGKNLSSAFLISSLLTSKEYVDYIAYRLGVAPVMKVSLAEKKSDGEKEAIRKSAIVARGWLNPGRVKTKLYLESMINATVANGNDEKVLSRELADFQNLLQAELDAKMKVYEHVLEMSEREGTN